MPAPALPEGFRWTWADDTVRINLPPVVVTDGHRLEPMLSRGIAERVAQAVGAHARKRLREHVAPPLKRVIVAHDPRYDVESLEAFQTKLSLALIEDGQKATIDKMTTLTGTDLDPDLAP